MDGVLVIDKPEGLTSHDVVAVARRVLRERRIGHTGTLDPLATGVLPLACGKATRLVRFLIASDKEYDATVRFGLTTDSYDITGNETSRRDGRVTREALEAAMATLRGAYLQTPPPYSAKKVQGVRAYSLARRDEPVELKAVPVNASRVELVEFDGERARIRLTVSAGFYVRTFAHELGQILGTGACLEALRRTRSGVFGLDEALGLSELETAADAWLIPLERLLPGFPFVTLTEEGRTRVTHGRGLEPAHYEATQPIPADGWVRLVDGDGHLVALGRPGATPDSLHPEVVLT